MPLLSAVHAKVKRQERGADPMSTIREIHYEADGQHLVGRLAIPDGDGPFPGVLIAHEGPGLDDVMRNRANVLAELGYAAFALDYHGDALPFESREAMMGRLGALVMNPDRTRALARAGLDVLLTQAPVDPKRVAAIGYCFGGTVALELGRSGADIKAIVGFHPGLNNVRPDDSRNITGEVLMLIGDDDPIVDVAQRHGFEAEVRAAGIKWQVHLYGGVQHSFTHPYADLANLPGIKYDKAAAEHSWNSMLDLIGRVCA
jgi:dienelactone hydrolase